QARTDLPPRRRRAGPDGFVSGYRGPAWSARSPLASAVELRLCAHDREGALIRSAFDGQDTRAVHVPLFFDFSLVDQHDRDFIADRIHPMALDAFQPLLVTLQFHGLFTQRANEYLKQFLADSHKRTLVYHVGVGQDCILQADFQSGRLQLTLRFSRFPATLLCGYIHETPSAAPSRDRLPHFHHVALARQLAMESRLPR